jgi:hypothetical protein
VTTSTTQSSGTFWFALALVNAAIAQQRGRSGLNWFLLSLLLGPLATLLLVIYGVDPPGRPDARDGQAVIDVPTPMVIALVVLLVPAIAIAAIEFGPVGVLVLVMGGLFVAFVAFTLAGFFGSSRRG